jgi:hypothetical protein
VRIARRASARDGALVADLLKLLLKIRARESNVAAKLVARSDELEQLAAGKREGLSILQGLAFRGVRPRRARSRRGPARLCDQERQAGHDADGAGGVRLVAGALLMMTACTAAQADEEMVPVHGTTPGFKCDAAKGQSLVGQGATSELGARSLQLTGARTLRWVRPGDMVTMDFREDRLNIELDERGRVKALSCG